MKNKGLNISLVVSKFYPDLVESLKFGVVDELKINRLKPV